MTAVAAATPAGAASEGDRLARSTATISAYTLVSRVTGFGRMFVLAAVVGTTYLGNTYQAANSVPNLVFELFAAGAKAGTAKRSEALRAAVATSPPA